MHYCLFCTRTKFQWIAWSIRDDFVLFPECQATYAYRKSNPWESRKYRNYFILVTVDYVVGTWNSGVCLSHCLVTVGIRNQKTWTWRMPRGALSPSWVRVSCRPCLIPGIKFNGGGKVVTPRWALGRCRIRVYPIPWPIPIIRFLRNDDLCEKTVVGQSENALECTVRNSIQKPKKKK